MVSGFVIASKPAGFTGRPKQSGVKERDCFVVVTPRSDIGGLSFRLELIRVKSLSGVFRS